MRTKRLGDMLIELGLLTNDQLKQALERTVWEPLW